MTVILIHEGWTFELSASRMTVSGHGISRVYDSKGFTPEGLPAFARGWASAKLDTLTREEK